MDLMKVQKQIKIGSYRGNEGFIHDYQKLIQDVVIPYQYEILNDRVEGAAKSHAIQNFINAAKVLKGEDAGDGFYGMVFQDSDVAKWLEAAAFSLSACPNSELERLVDQVVDIVADAQDADGYLNTFFTVKDREKRWSNLLEAHELYCAGHMMEAAVAYYEAAGKDKLLKVMLKNVKHIYRHFVENGAPGFPGHPEIELALMKMYRATGDTDCLELCRHFIDVRGVDYDYFKKEADQRGWKLWGMDPGDGAYCQSHQPVRAQKDAVGHSVRAAYLYTGMADLASETGDESLVSACRSLWSSIVDRRMYITGAIGSTGMGEAFTVDYDLPNDTVYGETCASIGLMFFASKMLELNVDGEYADVLERAFYNTVLAGMQLDGRRFFYVNPLEVIPGISGVAVTHKHDLPQRPAWYACACCPPNVARTISSFGKYAYGENDTTAYCHLFAAGDIHFDNGMEISCKTGYPYELTVNYEIIKGGKILAVRIPGWSRTYTVIINGQSVEAEKMKGYIYLDNLKDGDNIRVLLDDQIYRNYASSKVAADCGKVAFQRGPLVYCAEGADNEGDILSCAVKAEGPAKALAYQPDLLGGIVPLEIEGVRQKPLGSLYSTQKPEYEPCTIHAIPYYTWGNRGLNEMRVWLPEK